MRKALSLILVICVMLSLSFMLNCKRDASNQLELNTQFNDTTNLSSGGGRKVKVILLLGQSNATGCALNSYLETNVGNEKYKTYQNGFSNVLINYCTDNHTNTSNGEFVPVAVGCGANDEFFGPELGIAEKLSQKYQNEMIVILKYTYSGSCLKTQWLNNGKRGSLYNACIAFTSKYMNTLLEHDYDAKIGAICWMQGESDAHGKTANEYYDNQKFFISSLRDDLSSYANDDGIYFIDAGIEDISLWKKYEVINDAKARIAQSSPLNLYFSTIDAGLTTANEPKEEPDLAHYDSMSELTLGHLFGEYIIKAYE